MNSFRHNLLLASLLFSSTGVAADVYVASNGSDNNPGTRALPLATLARARDMVRPLAGKQPITVHVADGVYYLPEPLVLVAADSGSAQYPVIYQSEREGQAVLSGGLRLDLNWQPFQDGILRASIPRGLSIDQLFIDGKRQRMARYPNYDASQPTAAYQGFSADAFSKERAANWANPQGGFIHAMHKSRWGGYHYRILGKDPLGNVTYEGGWQNNRGSTMHSEFRMVENIFEELDAPGEWFHDRKANTLYYKPELGHDLTTSTCEIVRLRHLIELQGSIKSPVNHITLKGFTLRHAARTFMETKEPLLRSDWTIYRGGALVLTGTEDVSIIDAEFDQVGGNAIFISNYNLRTTIRGCHIHDAGASGVCFVGDPDAVREPLFGYGKKNDLSKIDRTPGPKTKNFPTEGIVKNCLIHGIGRVERQPAGVQISMSQDITVRDCSIYDCARAGINISEGTWGGHLIERCDVFDTVLETHDHGSFNSWGRDRYWRSDHTKASQHAVDQDPQLPFLDAMKTTVIRNSRWRCDHGWDIDLDDGSSNYEITNNLMLRGGLKLREGFRRSAWNNICVNNGLHPHVWFNHSKDEVFANIFMRAPKGVRAPSDSARGKRVDENLYFGNDDAMKDRYAQFGWDLNSVVADPLFVDPSQGDFRVRAGSPAFDVGFQNFPMDQFGVKKPALKQIARTPIIPQLDRGKPAARVTDRQAWRAYWLGARLGELKGEDFSAYGVSKEAGGVVLLEVPGDSEAARVGLQNADLIQRVGEYAISNTDQLLTKLAEVSSSTLQVTIVRDQQKKRFTLADSPFIATESIETANGLSRLPLPSSPKGEISANHQISDAPLSTLVDGKLAQGYGPVFRNGIRHGAYKMDLGDIESISAVTSWTFNKHKNRGPQKVTVYGSVSTSDPGWKLADPKRFTPLGSIITTGIKLDQFNAASLRARSQQSLGNFRWIVWSVAPVTTADENSAFQELGVEVSR